MWKSLPIMFNQKTGTLIERFILNRTGCESAKKVIHLGENSLKNCGINTITVSRHCRPTSVSEYVHLDGDFIVNGAEKHHIGGLNMEEFAAIAREGKKSGKPISIDFTGNNRNNGFVFTW